MKQRATVIATLALIAVLLAVAPVFAYIYRAPYTVISENTTDFEMLGVYTDNAVANQWMADNGFMNSTGNDTRIETLGGLDKPHMLTDDKTFTAIPVPAGSQTNLYFTTGESELDHFYVIPGYDGYVTVADEDVTLELGDNFTITQSGWWDTDNATDKNAVFKRGAFRTYVSPTVSENITSAILGGNNDLSYTANDYASKAAGVTSPAGATITIDVWFYLDALSGNQEAIVACGDKNVGFQYWWLYKQNDDTLIFQMANVGNSAQACLWTSTDDMTPGGWHFLTVAYDAAATPEVHVYMDGEEIEGNDVGDGTNIHPPTSRLTTGAIWDNAAYGDFWNGDIDEVRISDSVRTLADHIAHYDGGDGIAFTVDANTVHLWHFNDRVGATATDETGTDDLTVDGATWTNTSPVYGTSNEAFSVSATGVTSDEHVVSVTGSPLVFAEGNALHFIRSATSVINCGAISDNVSKLWVSFWFRLDSDWEAGVPANHMYLWSKFLNGDNYIKLQLNKDLGKLFFDGKTLNLGFFSLSSTTNSWDADTWYHVIASVSDTAGGTQRLLVDGDLEDSDTIGAVNTPISGDFRIGSYSTFATLGLVGELANFVTGEDDLSPAEELALFFGVAPGDETDLWYIDEGTGTAITSYGSSANPGTAGIANSWEESERPCKFVISIDGDDKDAFARPIDVPDTGNDWIFYQNNVLPYSDNTSIEVGGELELWFRPTSMIIGTTLPDRATPVANDGTFTFGSNPDEVSVTMGGLVSSSQPSPGVTVDDPTPDIMPGVEVTDWYIEPDVGGALLTNPMRPFVIILSDTTTLTELQAWRILGTALVLMVLVGTARAVRGHLLIAGIATSAIILGLVVWTIYPMWALVFIVVMVIGGLISERTPSV